MDGADITELVLLGGHNGDVGIGRLGLESDALAAACGGGHGKDVVVARQGDDGTLRGGNVDARGGGGDLCGMCDIHRGRHLRVEGKEGVAVCGEHFVCDGLVLCVVGPVALGKEVFAGHIAESGSPVAFIFGIGTVVGHELRVVLVVHAPSIGVVDEGVGGLRGTDAAYGAGVLSAAGATHEGLDEAAAVVVEGAGLAVDGVDEGQFAHIVHLGHIAGAEVRLAPALVVAVVAVLQKHAAAVDGIHDLCSSTACPTAEFRWRGRDVA